MRYGGNVIHILENMGREAWSEENLDDLEKRYSNLKESWKEHLYSCTNLLFTHQSTIHLIKS